VPMLARGVNQKGPKYRYRPRFLTAHAMTGARRRALRDAGSPQLDFRRDVLPLLALEVEHVYYTTIVRRRLGAGAAERFASQHVVTAGARRPDATRELLAEFGIADTAPVDLEAMARPFADTKFADPDEFHRQVLDLLALDLVDAKRGNVHGPLKAALDILRDLRGAVRAAVDFGGLRPDSHRDDFLGWFNPINTMLSAGPPVLRIEQVCALIDAKVLTMIGPDLTVDPAMDGSGFVLASPRVVDSARTVTALIDARIPRPSVHRDTSALTRQLLTSGTISEYVNVDPRTGNCFATGAVAVTRAPFRAIGADGRQNLDVYVLGLPSENQRWFTQIGNGRPGPPVGFHSDADAIACDALTGLASTRLPVQIRRCDLVGAGRARV
jgi:hypothetical protein